NNRKGAVLISKYLIRKSEPKGWKNKRRLILTFWFNSGQFLKYRHQVCSTILAYKNFTQTKIWPHRC
ncbi:MAG TPA: hypothetical protein VEL11_18775, partial [Candidatus Bathyarchaeia archaeon]|nr:hypothetical protein [Candidatus Bathyarchaeia archaeon]